MARRGAIVGMADLDAAGLAGTAQLMAADGAQGHAFTVDVSRRETLLDAVAEFRARCGPLDAVVASAMWIRYEPLKRCVTKRSIG